MKKFISNLTLIFGSICGIYIEIFGMTVGSIIPTVIFCLVSMTMGNMIMLICFRTIIVFILIVTMIRKMILGEIFIAKCLSILFALISIIITLVFIVNSYNKVNPETLILIFISNEYLLFNFMSCFIISDPEAHFHDIDILFYSNALGKYGVNLIVPVIDIFLLIIFSQTSTKITYPFEYIGATFVAFLIQWPVYLSVSKIGTVSIQNVYSYVHDKSKITNVIRKVAQGVKIILIVLLGTIFYIFPFLLELSLMIEVIQKHGWLLNDIVEIIKLLFQSLKSNGVKNVII